jgi:hypothetical protein
MIELLGRFFQSRRAYQERPPDNIPREGDEGRATKIRTCYAAKA